MPALSVHAEEFAVSNQFQADTPAVADEVNQNFSDVAAMLNAMNARIEQLENAANRNLCAQGSISAAYKGHDHSVKLWRTPAGDSDPNTDPDPYPLPEDGDYWERFSNGFTSFDIEYYDYDVCLNSDNTFYLKNTQHRRGGALAQADDGSVRWNLEETDDIGDVTEGTYVLASDCSITFEFPGGDSALLRGTPDLGLLLFNYIDSESDSGPKFGQQLTTWIRTTDNDHSCTPD